MTSTTSSFCRNGCSTSRAGTNCSLLVMPRHNLDPQTWHEFPRALALVESGSLRIKSQSFES